MTRYMDKQPYIKKRIDTAYEFIRALNPSTDAEGHDVEDQYTQRVQ